MAFERPSYYTVMKGDFGGQGPGEKAALRHPYVLVRDTITGEETSSQT